MTNQEVFDKVVTGVLKQGRKSVHSPGGTCKYRGTDGAKCAAGFLIKDECYIAPMENNLAVVLQERWPEAVEYTAEQANLVRALQVAHDQANDRDWEGKFSEKAFRDSFINFSWAVAIALTLDPKAAIDFTHY